MTASQIAGACLGLVGACMAYGLVLPGPAGAKCFYTWTLTLEGVTQVEGGDTALGIDSGEMGDVGDSASEVVVWPVTLDFVKNHPDEPSIFGEDISLNLRRSPTSSRLAESEAHP